MATKMKQVQQPDMQLANRFNSLKHDYRALAAKIAELEDDRRDHEVVIKALESAEKDRKCFRMVGGVLIERTVSEVGCSAFKEPVLPAVVTNKGGLEAITQNLVTQLETKGKELSNFVEKNNIKQGGPVAAKA